MPVPELVDIYTMDKGIYRSLQNDGLNPKEVHTSDNNGMLYAAIGIPVGEVPRYVKISPFVEVREFETDKLLNRITFEYCTSE